MESSRSEDYEDRIRDGLSDDLEEELIATDFAVLRELLKADADPDQNGLTQDELVEKTGRSKPHISNRLSLLKDKDLLEWSIPWGSQKRHHQLQYPERFDPYKDSYIPLTLLD